MVKVAVLTVSEPSLVCSEVDSMVRKELFVSRIPFLNHIMTRDECPLAEHIISTGENSSSTSESPCDTDVIDLLSLTETFFA